MVILIKLYLIGWYITEGKEKYEIPLFNESSGEKKEGGGGRGKGKEESICTEAQVKINQTKTIICLQVAPG